jgi:hypothetical protein
MAKQEIPNFKKRFMLETGSNDREFDESVARAKAEIMAVAIETSRRAVMIERQACAEIVLALAAEEDEGETCTALKNAAEAILNRIPSQRQ